MTVIYLVRHGQTCWNRDRRLQGQKDSPLTLLGISQVQAFASTLASELRASGHYELHASPLGRAFQSASIIAEGLEFPFERIQLEPRLQERNQGLWDGLTAPQIRDRFNPDPTARRSWNFAAPAGETLADVSARVGHWLDSLSAEIVVAVCHGVVSRIMRGAYLGLGPDDTIALESHDQDRLFKLDGGKVEPLLAETGGGSTGRPPPSEEPTRR